MFTKAQKPQQPVRHVPIRRHISNCLQRIGDDEAIGNGLKYQPMLGLRISERWNRAAIACGECNPRDNGDMEFAEYKIKYAIVLPTALILGITLIVVMVFSPWAIPASAHYSPWLIVPLTLAQIGIHELTHAVVAYFAGAKPKIGLRILVAYCTFTQRINWGAYLMAAAAPLVLLTILSLSASLWPPIRIYALVFFLLNTAGSVGDAYIIALLLRQPHNAIIEDIKDGFRIYPR
jgi:hypothetical protein